MANNYAVTAQDVFSLDQLIPFVYLLTLEFMQGYTK